MSITPTTHNFGQVAVNNAATLREFTITNHSSGTIALGAFTTNAELGLAAPFQYQNGDTNLCYGGKTLASGVSCTIKVGTNSSVAGTFNDALVMPYVKNSVNGSVSASLTVTYNP